MMHMQYDLHETRMLNQDKTTLAEKVTQTTQTINFVKREHFSYMGTLGTILIL